MFQYAVPSGYLALCTRNVDDSTLGPNSDELPNQHFQNYLFTGNSSSTRTISGLNFQPDLLWSKTRNQGLLTDFTIVQEVQIKVLESVMVQIYMLLKAHMIYLMGLLLMDIIQQQMVRQEIY